MFSQLQSTFSTGDLLHTLAKAGITVCLQSLWKSDSSATCRSAPGYGVGLSAQVSIFMQVGHISFALSYTTASIRSYGFNQLP